MKKNLLWCLALTSLVATTSCSQDETVDEPTPQRHAIGFSSFIDKATRAELSTSNLDAFKVWAYEKTEGSTTGNYILSNSKIEKKADGSWNYAIESQTAYWRPGSNYVFLGVAPADQVTQTSGSGSNITVTVNNENPQEASILFVNVNGETDLIASINDSFYTTPWTTGSPTTAAMSFNHLLSRIRFAFENGMQDGSSLEISNVTITDSPYKGQASVSKAAVAGGSRTEATWAATAEAPISNTYANLNFGGAIKAISGTQTQVFENVGGNVTAFIKNGHTAETKALLIIPDTNTPLHVDFTIKHKKGELETTYKKVGVVITMPAEGWKSGYCYQLKAKITAENIDESEWQPILFQPTVVDWIEAGEQPFTVTGFSTPAPVRRR